MKCIGNCVKCELVSSDEKMTCCAFQSLKQEVEIRTQLKVILDKLELIASSRAIDGICDTELPAVDIQEDKPKRTKK